MTSDKDMVEMTVGKGGQYEARLDVDDKTSFVIKDITNVRFSTRQNKNGLILVIKVQYL